MYGSFSYFSGRTGISNLKLLTSNDFLKFLIEKKLLKSNLKLHLPYVNGSEVPTSDKKNHAFSITKLVNRKRKMTEPIDSIIIRAQQTFDIKGGLNPIRIAMKGDRISNILKKHRNANYKIIPLGLPFPASITNDTKQIFVLRKNLNGIKKLIVNQKIFDILAVIDIEKINNWKDIKGQSVWTKIITIHLKIITI